MHTLITRLSLHRLWREYRGLAVCLALMLVFRASWADWVVVPTGSMNPTIVEGDRVLRLAERVGCDGFLESDGRGDLSGKDLLHLFALVGVHAHDAADALLVARARVVHI